VKAVFIDKLDAISLDLCMVNSPLMYC